MGEEKKERKKPSSLRTRVDRTRKTYQKTKNPVPMIIGGVVLLLFLVGLYAFLGQSGSSSSKRRPPKRRQPVESETGTKSSAPLGFVAREPKNAFEFVSYASIKRRNDKDPEGALRMLKEGLSKWGDVPDVHCEMAYAVDAIIAKTKNDPAALRRLREEKLAHYKKALELVESGKSWDTDQAGNKTGNLKTSIEQAEAALGR
ncbi:MAG: hypothetical protein ACYSU0_15580 [Planctomycetota bacterium]|jgi:hypothetical protein